MRGAKTVKGDISRKNYPPSGGSSFSNRAVPIAEQETDSLARKHCSRSWCQMGFLSSTVTQQSELEAETPFPPPPKTF